MKITMTLLSVTLPTLLVLTKKLRKKHLDYGTHGYPILTTRLSKPW